jgi:hypothetical protein
MKLALLALAVVGASAQTAPVNYFLPTTQQAYPVQTMQTQYTWPTATAATQYTWPTATAAAGAFDWNSYYAQQQAYNPYQFATQAPAPSRTEAPTRNMKTAADFSANTLACVRALDAFCRTGWDEKCTGHAESRQCTSAGTIATAEAILRCIWTKGKNGRDGGVSTNNGDEWCDKRLAQWDENCDKAEAYCKEDVEANVDEADRLSACVSSRDSWCDKGKKWDDACTAVENLCKAPVPTEAPRAERISDSATMSPIYNFQPLSNFQYPVQQFSNYNFQYPTTAGYTFNTDGTVLQG